ncbi:MAG: LysM peptidoglycan-binding domain-containing protein [Treponema sp.]|jgi:outer membrane biosynthesis protein TonB|nr:LysM peptidoglycan-binding domain-containing protein [Treponema sp.]
MASNIGIKIANGEFYPLVEENSLIKKRLILTTVHDNQPSVQIDLYRSNLSSMTDSQYIGSLVIENIQSKPKGEPSIEMVISSNKDGEIVADAVDLDTGADGEHYILTVSLKSLDESARDMEIPDFELESGEESSSSSSLYNKAEKVRKEKSGGSLAWLLVLLLLILLGLAAWILFFGGKEVISSLMGGNKATEQTQPAQTEPERAPPAPPPTDPTPQPVQPAQPTPPPPVITAPAQPPAPRTEPARRDRPPAPVSSYNVPSTIPREGVNYTIRWGDTLWDISEAFYRNPWLYPRIAQHNNIRNPNLIISGRTIKIPPRN